MNRPILVLAALTLLLAPVPVLLESVTAGAPQTETPEAQAASATPAVARHRTHVVRTRTTRVRPRRVARVRRSPVIRYRGSEDDWTLADAPRVQEFFEDRFGRELPISAWGQTRLHDRLRLDHRNAFDVAVHPDSAEGRELMAFLRDEGIPFVAIRARSVHGTTGPHIHIGHESIRVSRATIKRFTAERLDEARRERERARPDIFRDEPVVTTSLTDGRIAEKPGPPRPPL
jgi:hypothetical protein